MILISPGDIGAVMFIGAVATKRRPAIVLSAPDFNDQNNDVIVALVTTNLALASTPFDYHLQDWQAANLKAPSAVRMFVGMSQVSDVRPMSRLSEADWNEVQARLRLALEV